MDKKSFDIEMLNSLSNQLNTVSKAPTSYTECVYNLRIIQSIIESLGIRFTPIAFLWRAINAYAKNYDGNAFEKIAQVIIYPKWEILQPYWGENQDFKNFMMLLSSLLLTNMNLIISICILEGEDIQLPSDLTGGDIGLDFPEEES